MRWLQKYDAPIYALLRVVAGFLFFCHGAQKAFGAFGGHGGESLPPLILAAGWIEVAGGALIALGLFTGIAAFISSGEMAVAYFMVHQPKGILPVQNQGDLAVILCFVFLYIAVRGSGAFALDGLFAKKGG
ncbi:MAG TPA: DoxX family protein [Thermoanaerobaculia bacterium]|nr:DoxX family protein [Thermoanaerobaculia bacterium]